MKKTIVSLIILVILVISVVITSGLTTKTSKENTDGKIQIVTTVFPLYDFIKNVGGDKVDVSMIIPSGVDVHDYEPTPQDIILINDSDLFIYMGEDLEYWAKTLVEGIDDRDKIIDVVGDMELIETEEFEHEYGIEEDEDEHEHHHDEKYDTHIWLDPTKSIEMVKNIENKLSSIDKDNADYYKKNSESYIAELENLDSDIKEVVSNSDKNKIAFGGPFAYAYFIKRYDLEFISAYDSCGENGEPSVFKVKEVIDYINKNDIKVIFYKELSSGNIARTISEETNSEMLEFNSLHTVTEDELEKGTSYIYIMRRNLSNLEKALKS